MRRKNLLGSLVVGLARCRTIGSTFCSATASAAPTTSENGWNIIPLSETSCFDQGRNATFCLANDDVAAVFADLVDWFDDNIEPVGEPFEVDEGKPIWALAANSDDGSWFAPQYIPPAGVQLSNHGSATSVDINFGTHPIDKGLDTVTPEQQQKIRDKIAEYDGLIAWGGDYQGHVDPMHFELQVGKTNDDVRAVMDKLGIKSEKFDSPPDVEMPNLESLGLTPVS